MKKIILTYSLSFTVILFCKAITVVTPGAFPTMCQGQGYVTQTTDIVIEETLPGDFGYVTCVYMPLELYAPTGYEFEAGVGTVTCTAGRDIPGISIIVGGSYVQININRIYSFTNLDKITISGLRMKANIGAPGSSNLYKTNIGCEPPMSGNMATDNVIHATVNSIPYTLTIDITGVFCSDDATPIPIVGTPGTGTYSGPGASGSNFTSSVAGTGSKTITYTTVVSGCTYSINTTVVVKAPPTVSLTQNPTGTLCPGTSVTFTGNVSTGTNKRYQFFVNGIPVTTLSTTAYQYTTTTLVNGDIVTFMGDNGNGTCQKTSSPITMTFASAASVTVDVPTLPALVCSNTSGTYPITKSPAGGTLSGPGVSGNNFSPTLAGVGTKTITYTTIIGGCSYSATKDIPVNVAPTATLTSSDADNVVCNGDNVTFTANTTGLVSRYEFWSGGNVALGNPMATNVFDTTGLKNGDYVFVRVDNGPGSCQAYSNNIIMTVGDIPTSLFSWKSTCGQNQVTFHDLSSVTGSSALNKWEWDYTNDGSVDYTQMTSTPDALYNFGTTNTYQTRLRVTSNRGCYKDTVIRVYTLPGKTPTVADPYAINFTTSNEGWAYDGVNPSWGWGIAPSDFGAGTRKIWSTGQNSPDGKYKTAEHSYLYGPCINFSQLDKPMLAIKLSSKITDKPAGAILEATTDEGLNWIKLGNVDEGLNWYNVAGIVSTPYSQLANITNNNPNAQGWATDTINFNNNRLSRLGLQNYAGKTSVRFRINFASVADVNAARYAGIGIDSVWIGNRNKTVLIEHFTNNGCQPISCNVADGFVNTMRSKRNKDVAPINYYTSFPASNSFNNFDAADPSSAVFYYGITNPPFTILDGSYYKGNQYTGGTAKSRIDTVDIDARALENAKFKLDLTTKFVSGKIDAALRVTYNNINNPFNSGVTIRFAIVEDTADGNTLANAVLRKMLPDAAGIFVVNDWKANPIKEFSQNWINSFITTDKKLAVVAFVQDGTTKEIHQAILIKGAGTVGDVVITEVTNLFLDNGNKIIAYPNPAINETFVQYDQPSTEKHQWYLMDPVGKVIDAGNTEIGDTGFTINTSIYSAGVYQLKIIAEKNKVHSLKLVIVK